MVVAFDDSPGARRALERAVELAHPEDAEVIVVAVEAHLPHYGATVGEVTEELEVEERDCHRWLAAAEAYAAEHGITVAGEVRAGHPAQELVRAAEEHEADLIVVGHSGHSSVWGRFLGATAEKISRHAPCSVLIVR
ncbi:Universal stress protein UspA-related nucleotide-binding proteins [Streptomyces formicae]|uniref:Universal stress protein n=2 Tax=Streptomyces formicae TaxID=1616117 RepID=A0A291QCJ1_9ACTN|nr:Universal stress protein UspA-related nucleotide-binding proteins [Streptomyces formicae]